MYLLLSADFFQNCFFLRIMSATVSVSNGLEKDQDQQHSVGPDLGLNCLQRLSADDKSMKN